MACGLGVMNGCPINEPFTDVHNMLKSTLLVTSLRQISYLLFSLEQPALSTAGWCRGNFGRGKSREARRPCCWCSPTVVTTSLVMKGRAWCVNLGKPKPLKP
jgi:hypothetical protein